MGGVESEKQHGNGLVRGSCFNDRHNYGKNIRHIVRYCAVTFEGDLKLMVNYELSSTDAIFFVILPSAVMTNWVRDKSIFKGQ